MDHSELRRHITQGSVIPVMLHIEALEGELKQKELQLDQTRKDRDSLIEERNKAVSDWQGKLLEATDIAKKALEDADELQKRIDAALKELGVPQPGYPAPVANAVDILTNGLKRICEHEWQDVEAVVHGADQCKKCFVLRQKPGLR